MGAETIEYGADNAELEALLQSIDRFGQYEQSSEFQLQQVVSYG